MSNRSWPRVEPVGKLKNENNNILKTKGYHLEHNFGHGKRYLSNTLLTLNLLAFLFHTVLEMFDDTYRRIREDLPTRKTFFDDIRALTRYMFFDSWEVMLAFMAHIVGARVRAPRYELALTRSDATR